MAIDSKDNAKIFVEEIRKIVEQYVQKMSREKLCEIDSVNDDGTLNIYIGNDFQNVVHNVINESRYNFKKGDMAYVYLIDGKLSNSFVFAKCAPKKEDDPSLSNRAALQGVEDQIEKIFVMLGK